MFLILDRNPAKDTILSIEKQYQERFSEAKIISLGPILLGDVDLSAVEYGQYERMFDSITRDDLIRVAEKYSDIGVTTVFLVPTKVYDVYFNSDISDDVIVYQERECQLFVCSESELRLRKIGHYAAVIIRNRGDYVSRSDVMDYLMTNSMHSYQTENWSLTFMWKGVCKSAGMRDVRGAAYLEFVSEDRFRKYATSKEISKALIGINLTGNGGHIIVFPDPIYEFYMKNPGRYDVKKGVTIVSEGFLMFDPTTNFLVPEHILIDEIDRSVLSEKYGDLNKLPKISVRDTISMWYGFKVGDVIEIRRTIGGVDEKYYRMVTEV
jgi:DNA-directed RNA polymerase subunit H (RpoH/RPB5)